MATATFSMRMDAGVKRKLEAQATLENRSAAYLANRAIEGFLERQDAIRESILKAIAEADGGVFVSSEAVERWMERWADGHNDVFPEPDIFPGLASVAAAE